MLAIIGNFGWGETLITLVIAVLIFGKNLPEVAGRVFGHIRRARQAIEGLRRETGIDRDFREMGRAMQDAERDAREVSPIPPSTSPPSPGLTREPEDGSTPPVAEESQAPEGEPEEWEEAAIGPQPEPAASEKSNEKAGEGEAPPPSH